MACDFPTGGRALLQYLRDLALSPLTTSEVNSVLADIKQLTETGKLSGETLEKMLDPANAGVRKDFWVL